MCHCHYTLCHPPFQEYVSQTINFLPEIAALEKAKQANAVFEEAQRLISFQGREINWDVNGINSHLVSTVESVKYCLIYSRFRQLTIFI